MVNYGEFYLGENEYEDPENDEIEWSHKYDLLISEQEHKGLSEDPKIMSEIYQDISTNDVDRKIPWDILSEHLR